MDFDIGNILYVVITLVAIIASLLGKKKKPEGKKAKPGFFENLEQVLKMGQEDPALVNLKDHEPDLPKEDEEIVYEDVREDRVINTQETTTQPATLKKEYKSSILPVEDFSPDEEEPEFLEILKDFDAGSAVVYSAIINRPDY